MNINRLIDESSNTITEPEQCVSPPHSPSPRRPPVRGDVPAPRQTVKRLHGEEDVRGMKRSRAKTPCGAHLPHLSPRCSPRSPEELLMRWRFASTPPGTFSRAWCTSANFQPSRERESPGRVQGSRRVSEPLSLRPSVRGTLPLTAALCPRQGQSSTHDA